MRLCSPISTNVVDQMIQLAKSSRWKLKSHNQYSLDYKRSDTTNYILLCIDRYRVAELFLKILTESFILLFQIFFSLFLVLLLFSARESYLSRCLWCLQNINIPFGEKLIGLQIVLIIYPMNSNKHPSVKK